MKLDKTKEEIAAHIQHALDIDKHSFGERGDHQKEAVKRAAKHLLKDVGEPIILPKGQRHDEHSDYLAEKQSDHFLIVSATGTGKTRILGGIMDGAEVPTLLLTPRKLLNKQMMDEFCDEMDIPAEMVGLIDGDITGKAREEALKKPYLISTFQSLPTLVDNTTGKFKLRRELGKRQLCLLDEAHTAQGPQTSAILKDLQEEMVVGGVTATEAGVSKTLFNGQAPIFNLDLVTAIQQGKLATGVKTGLIDVKLDEAWVEELARTPKWQEFSRRSVERFAKTPATIKAMAQFHLSYQDERLGKVDRFPTLVFTEGVAAARLGADTFNEMAEASGSKARAAFVSGEMDPNLRNEILESYKKGEISVLFNDRMLEMGYDLPEATVVYSLKPTQQRYVAEQQLGRVTRREPKDYFNKYGMNKVALAINVRPQGVIPYLYGEVIGNRPSLYQSGMEPTGNGLKGGGSLGAVSELKLSDAQFHTNYDEVASIIATSPRQKIAPDLIEGFGSKAEVAQYLRIHERNPQMLKLWDELVAIAEALPRDEDGSVEIPFEGRMIKMGYFKNHTHQSWYLSAGSIEEFAQCLGKEISEATLLQPGFLKRNEVAAQLRMGVAQFKVTWDELVDSASKLSREDGIVALPLGDEHVQMGYFKNGGNESWYLAKDSLAPVAKHLGRSLDSAPPVPNNFHSSTKVSRLVRMAWAEFSKKWEPIVKQAETLPKDADNRVTVILGDGKLKLGYFRSDSTETWYLAEESVSDLLAYLGKKEKEPLPLPEGFTGKDKLRSVIGIDPKNPAFKFWNDLVAAAEQAGVNESGVVDVALGEKTITMGHFKNRAQEGWYIADKSIPDLAEHLNLDIRPAHKLLPGFSRKDQVAIKMKTKWDSVQFTETWQKLVDAAEAAPKDDNGLVVLKLVNQDVTMGFFKSGKHKTWYLANESIPVLAQQLGKEVKKERVSSFATMANKVVGSIKPEAVANQKAQRGGWAK